MNTLHFEADTLDDLLRMVFPVILNEGMDITSTRGSNRELVGVSLTLTDPRARLSRTETKGKIFSALGEFLWYLSGDNALEPIEYYIPLYKKDAILTPSGQYIIYGGYGPRLFNMHGKYNQITNIIDLLDKNPGTRKAVIQIFDAEDVASKQKEIPCTCTLQFFNRNGHLHMCVYMRSNDAYFGLPHDVFTFTMLQESIACALNLKLGKYYHSVGSLHIYEDYQDDAKQFLTEGWQSKITMPPMPLGAPWEALDKLLVLEARIRTGTEPIIPPKDLAPYWADFIYLLNIFKHRSTKEMKSFADLISTPVYKIYAEPYLTKKKKKKQPSQDLPLPFEEDNVQK